MTRLLLKRARAALSRTIGAFAGNRGDNDTRDEFASHVEMETAENIRRGMSPNEAHRQAMIASGGLSAAAELVRERRGLPWVESIVADVRYSARGLRRAPAYTIVAAATLALGIGANTAIFSVINGVLLKPLPYPDANQLVTVSSLRDGREMSVSVPDFVDWQQQSHSFIALAAGATSSTVLTGIGEPVQLRQARVTANTFDVLAMRPLLGRAFVAGEDLPSAPRVAMLGERLWKARFGGDSGVIGKTLMFDGFPTTVVGVVSSSMTWPENFDVWMTTRFTDRDRAAGSRGGRWLAVIARVKPGLAIETANADMLRLARQLAHLDPNHNTNIDARVRPMLSSLVGDVRQPLMLLLGAVALVLLIACANVASLSLARVASRDAELAVRTALGASKPRIARQILTESVLLACVGGTAGILLAFAGIRALIAIAPPDIPRLNNVALDTSALLFAFVATTVTAVLFGSMPAVHGASSKLHDRLRAAGRGAGAMLSRTRRALVISEVALSIMLLSGAGLLLRSFALLREVDPGFRAEQVSTFNVSLPGGGKYETGTRIREFNATLLASIARQPGVTSAATSFALPLSNQSTGFTFTVQGQPAPDPANEPRAQARIATPDYFKTMGIPVIRGRVFDNTDRDDTRQVMVISSEVARRFFPNSDPIGQYIQTGWTMSGRKFGGEVIGIVGDVRQAALDQDRTAHIYMPYAQWSLDEYDVVIRSTAPTTELFKATRGILKQLDAQIPMNDARSLADIVESSLGQRKFYLKLLGAFAVVAMSLALVGIYGVIAYGVQQRRREIGIRLALGATSRRVVGMVLRDGLQLVAIGAVLGTAGALALTRLLQSLLYGVSARDPITFVAAGALLSIAAACACLMPARAAARLDPTETIRGD